MQGEPGVWALAAPLVGGVNLNRSESASNSVMPSSLPDPVKEKLLRLSEVTAEAVSRFLRSLTVPKLNDAKATVRKAVSARTVNAHRADIIAFVAWTERNGLTPDKRLSGLVPKLDENADRRKVRRALTSEELGRLIGDRKSVV
mgnify:CR=1 FL=1